MVCRLSPKQSIIKNILAFDVSFMLIYAALNGLVSVQSVLNKDGGLGLLSLTVAFVTQILTCIVFPQAVVELAGFKGSLILSEICATLYVASNMYPIAHILLPGDLTI